MSNSKSELEELRRIRAAERIRLEEEAAVQAEKDAIKAKRAAFMAKANAFSGNKAPSDADVKASITKASESRKFSKLLNKTLNSDDGQKQSPFALEMKLKGKLIDNEGESLRLPPPRPPPPAKPINQCVWEKVEQGDNPAYYWNKSTNEVTYDCPEELKSKQVNQAIQSNQTLPEGIKELEIVVEEIPLNPWTKVDQSDGSPPYYWNTITNVTTFEVPNEFLETNNNINNNINYRSISEDVSTDETTNWQECVSDNGSIYYSNLAHADKIRYDVPVGQRIIICYDDNGVEVDWEETIITSDMVGEGDESAIGSCLYTNLATYEQILEKPLGGILLIREIN